MLVQGKDDEELKRLSKAVWNAAHLCADHLLDLYRNQITGVAEEVDRRIELLGSA